MKTIKDTQNLKQRYRKPSRRGFQIISYMYNLKVKQALANQICCTPLYGVYVHNDPKRQKIPKRVKMSTSKWHPKQRHFFIQPFRSLQCIRFVGRNFLSRTSLSEPVLSGEGGEFSTFSTFEAPLHFKLDQTGRCTTWLLGLQYKTIIGSLWYLATEETR